MTELCKIMNKYGSDKGSGWHNYTTTYHNMFKKKREEKLNIFELGIGDEVFVENSKHNAKSGASIRGWKDYFPNSNVYGADIDKTILFEDERIKTFYCDQLDASVIKEMWGNSELNDKKFDIIIDDGLHEFDANLNFFKNSIHKLKDDGVFIIEDLHMITLPKFKQILPQLKLEYSYLDFSILEILNTQNYSDNNIVVIQRKELVNHIDHSSNDTKLQLSTEEFIDKLTETTIKKDPVINRSVFNINNKKKVIDCFTFYNELEMLELRLSELYDVVDYFILAESTKTHKGEEKRLEYEENKERFSKWSDKIINIKVSFPDNLDAWGREKFQRNSFMPTLYSLGLGKDDIIIIADVDEIPDAERIGFIKNSYKNVQKDGWIYKLEMDMYFGCLSNKQTNVKWYHPKIMNWEKLKSSTPDQCRLTFDCQWWEKAGWHFTSFGDPNKIANKLENFAHQEYNNESYKDKDYILNKVKEGKDLFRESRTYKKISPENNSYLPKNWRILEKFDEYYTEKISDNEQINLVLGTAINLPEGDLKKFIKSFRKFNKKDDLYLVVSSSASIELLDFLKYNDVSILTDEFTKLTDIHMNNSRFYKYLDFIQENKKRYKNILLTDTRDVLFQKNIFDEISKDPFIFFAEEDEDETIRSNSFNSNWIRLSFGEETLNKLGSNKIICAGTTIGSTDNIIVYLREMIKIFGGIKKTNHKAFYESIDQGVHNYIFYERSSIFQNPILKHNGDVIATIGITITKNPERITISINDALDYISDKDSKINIMVNGKIPSLIHQFDRSEKITNFYNKIYQ
jgi:hypothetical protein